MIIFTYFSNASIHQPMVSQRKNRQSGAEMVEFSITIIYFLFLVFLIIEGSRLMFTYTAISYHANDALRYASLRGAEAYQDNPDRTDLPIDVDKIKNYILGKSVIKLTSGDIVVCIGDSNCNGNTSVGEPISVTVNYPFHTAIPFLSSYLDKTFAYTTRGEFIY